MARKISDRLSSNPEDLDGVTKAAILLVAIGPEQAAAALQRLGSDAVEMVTRELAGLGRVPQDLRRAIVDEFYGLSLAIQAGDEGNLDYARELLRHSMDPKMADRVLQQI